MCAYSGDRANHNNWQRNCCKTESPHRLTEMHLPDAGHMMLDEEKGYSLVFSGWNDRSTREGVGLALNANAWAVLRQCHHTS